MRSHLIGLAALLVTGLLAHATQAAELNLELQLPEQKVAEYHRPYVAVWVERADKSVAAQLAVWYQQRKGNAEGEGTKWLKDLRQWWRRGGRDLSLPLDGLSGATHPVGVHSLSFNDKQGVLKDLAPGDYSLQVEAVREVGGREVLSLPFQWPPKAARHTEATVIAQGQHELGTVRLHLKP